MLALLALFRTDHFKIRSWMLALLALPATSHFDKKMTIQP
jgi:hypothetical protein